MPDNLITVTNSSSGRSATVVNPYNRTPTQDEADELVYQYYKSKPPAPTPKTSVFDKIANSPVGTTALDVLSPAYSSTLGKLAQKTGLSPKVNPPESIEGNVTNLAKDVSTPFTPAEEKSGYPTISRVGDTLSNATKVAAPALTALGVGGGSLGELGVSGLPAYLAKSGATLGAGMLAQKGIEKGGEAAGVPTPITNLASQVGGLATSGIIAGKLFASPEMPQEAPPVQPPVVKDPIAPPEIPPEQGSFPFVKPPDPNITYDNPFRNEPNGTGQLTLDPNQLRLPLAQAGTQQYPQVIPPEPINNLQQMKPQEESPTILPQYPKVEPPNVIQPPTAQSTSSFQGEQSPQLGYPRVQPPDNTIITPPESNVISPQRLTARQRLTTLNVESPEQPNVVAKQPKETTVNPEENKTTTTSGAKTEETTTKETNTQLTEYEKALETSDPKDINSLRSAARLGLIQKIDPEVIASDLAEQGIDEEKAKSIVKAQAIKLRGERGFLGKSPDKPSVEDYANREDIPNEERTPSTGFLSGVKATLGRTHEYLKNSGDPNAAKIGQTIPEQYDQEQKWKNQYQKELGQDSGLNKLSTEDRLKVTDVLNGEDTDISPEVQKVASSIRTTLDNMWKDVDTYQDKEGIGLKKSGEKMGYLEDYFSRLKKESPVDIWNGMKDFFLGDKGEKPIFHDTDLDESIGKPKSSFAETRTNKPEELEKDPNIVLGKYLNGISRLRFRKGTMIQLMDNLDQIPDGKLKDTATDYLKSYANKNPYASDFLDPITRTLMNTDSRSRMLLNPGLWSLHLSRLGFISHDIPVKYIAKGTAEVFKNGLKNSIDEAVQDGLVQSGNQSPNLLESTGQKITKAMSAYRIADAIPEVFGKAWNKARFLDQGMSEEDANNAAITKTKNESLTTDPVRQSELFSRYLQGPLKIAGQYKQVQANIVEKYLRDSAKVFGSDKTMSAGDRVGMASRMIANTIIAYEITHAVGVKAQHFTGSFLTSFGGAVGDEASKIGKMVAKGDYGDAATELAIYLTPGGKSIQTQVKSGKPSFMEPTDSTSTYPTVQSP